MAAEADLRAARAAGDRAADLLKDPVLSAAFDKMEAGFFTAWKATPLERADQRERLYLMFQCIATVRKELDATVQAAILADAQLRANGLS